MRNARLLVLLGAILVIVSGIVLERRWRVSKSEEQRHAPHMSTAEMIERARRATKDSMVASEQRSSSRWARKRQQTSSAPVRAPDQRGREPALAVDVVVAELAAVAEPAVVDLRVLQADHAQ